MGAAPSQDEVSQPINGGQGKHLSSSTPPPPPPQRNNENDEAAVGSIRIATTTTTPQVIKLNPHNHEHILKDADVEVDKSSTEKLHDQLYSGVFLNQHNKKYWVDRNSMKNCFMLYAKDLSITWGEDTSYWHWPLIKESSGESVVAAELLNVCWLEVHGRFNTINLTPTTVYEVVFVVMLKDPAYGWGVPVNLRLFLPNGSRQEHKENMMEKTRGRWIEIPAGEFETLQENTGNMEISLYEYEGGIWKRGLVIKGILIRPKKLKSLLKF